MRFSSYRGMGGVVCTTWLYLASKYEADVMVSSSPSPTTDDAELSSTWGMPRRFSSPESYRHRFTSAWHAIAASASACARLRASNSSAVSFQSESVETSSRLGDRTGVAKQRPRKGAVPVAQMRLSTPKGDSDGVSFLGFFCVRCSCRAAWRVSSSISSDE